MTEAFHRATAIWRRFQSDESGATALEYALLAMLVALPLVASVTILGGSLSGKFTSLSTAF